MSISVGKIGSLLRLKATITDINGDVIDPTTVSLEVKKPSGSTDSYSYPATINRTSTGVYYKEITRDESGDWHYRWEATGTGQAAKEHQFMVEPSNF